MAAILSRPQCDKRDITVHWLIKSTHEPLGKHGCIRCYAPRVLTYPRSPFMPVIMLTSCLIPLAVSTSWPIDQSHRYGHPHASCREPAGSFDKTTRTAICFEHKTQYLLIRAPYTRIVVCWHISNINPMISQCQISCNTPTFYIAAIFVKYCYTTGSWLL